MSEMPTHVVHSHQTHTVAVSLPKPPLGFVPTDRVVLLLDGYDFEMTTAAWRQFAACVCAADQELFGENS